MAGEPRSNDKFLKGWLFYLPLLVCVVLMLPRLFSPQFGLFDDGKTLITAKEMAKNISYFTFEADQGRFRPVYWLYFSVIDWIFGPNAFWFFLGNTIVLVLSTWMLMIFTQLVTGRRFQAWAAGLLFALSGPVIESFYTLSKGEPLQVALLLLGILSSIWTAKAKVLWKKVIFGLLGLLTIFSALAVKETTLVMVPISLTWLILAWLRGRKTSPHEGLRDWGMRAWAGLAIFSILGSGLFLILRRVMIRTVLTGGTYTNDYAFQVQTILASLVRWVGWSIRDFTFILPVMILAVLWLMTRKKSFDTGFIPESFFWMGGWAVIYLPWLFMTEYYMLPFAAGAAVFSGALLDLGLEALGQSKGRLRGLAVACLGISVILWGMTLFNNASNAGIQLAVDKANARMVAAITKSAPSSSTIFVNIQDPNEYFYEIGLHFSAVNDRPDLEVLPLAFQYLSTGQEVTPRHFLLISPYVENQPLMVVRMGIVEATQVMWNEPLPGYLSTGNWQENSILESKFRLLMFNLPRLLCPVLKGRNFCANQAPILDRRIFKYGWKIYSLDLP